MAHKQKICDTVAIIGRRTFVVIPHAGKPALVRETTNLKVYDAVGDVGTSLTVSNLKRLHLQLRHSPFAFTKALIEASSRTAPIKM